MNLNIPSGIKKSTTNPLRTRPTHTPFVDEEARAADCAIAAELEDDIFLLPLF
jgi:hypothetical protein